MAWHQVCAEGLWLWGWEKAGTSPPGTVWVPVAGPSGRAQGSPRMESQVPRSEVGSLPRQPPPSWEDGRESV